MLIGLDDTCRPHDHDHRIHSELQDSGLMDRHQSTVPDPAIQDCGREFGIGCDVDEHGLRETDRGTFPHPLLRLRLHDEEFTESFPGDLEHDEIGFRDHRIRGVHPCEECDFPKDFPWTGVAHELFLAQDLRDTPHDQQQSFQRFILSNHSLSAPEISFLDIVHEDLRHDLTPLDPGDVEDQLLHTREILDRSRGTDPFLVLLDPREERSCDFFLQSPGIDHSLHDDVLEVQETVTRHGGLRSGRDLWEGLSQCDQDPSDHGDLLIRELLELIMDILRSDEGEISQGRDVGFPGEDEFRTGECTVLIVGRLQGGQTMLLDL